MSTTDTDAKKSFLYKSHSYLAGIILVCIVIPVPTVATIFTAAIFIAPMPIWLQSFISSWTSLNWFAIIVGFGITLVYWLLSAFFVRNFTSIESANSVSGNHLKNHFCALRASFVALQDLNEYGKPLPKERIYSYRIAHEQVKTYIEEIEELFDRKDMRWILGSGYLQAWNLVHRAEEAMITLEPREEVIREAIYDEMCITGSSMTARASALNKLELAVRNISQSATQYLDYKAHGDLQTAVSNSEVEAKNLEDPTTSGIAIIKDEKNLVTDGTSIVTVQGQSVATTNGTPNVTNEDPIDALASGTSILTTQDSGSDISMDKQIVLVNGERIATTSESPAAYVIAEIEARNALRDTRRILNEYRANLWEGLVTGRNLLMGTALITGLITYVLICFAIIADASPATISAAIAFYLVGALVGLFSRLYSESKADNSSNDYSLTMARIIVTPVLAGIAGVIGVLLITMLSITLLKSALPENITLAAPELGLGDSFNLHRNSLGILIAAAFALTPNLLINTLNKQANDFADKLRNTGVSGQATSSNQSQSGNKR